MIIELVAGTVGTLGLLSGIGALVFWKKNGNHELMTSNLQQQAPAPVQVQWPPEMAELLERLNHPLVQTSVQPPWHEVVGELERITQRVLVAARRASDPPPEWATRLTSDLAENDKRLARIAEDLSENMADGMARFYSQVSKDLAAAVDLPALAEIADKLDRIVDNIPDPDPDPEMTVELVKQLAELPAKVGKSVSEAISSERAAQPANAKRRNDSPPPPPRPPRALPPMNPNELPATPSIPAAYVPGTIDVPAGQVWSLLYLIQKQLSPNCPGSSVEFALSSDADILVGGASSIGGPLSETNYAYKLTATSEPRIYRATYPGGNTPVGELQVLAPAGGTLHVEVQS